MIRCPIIRIFSAFIFLFGLSFAQDYDVKLEKIVNYNNWGTAWDTIFVVKNDLITIAALPKVGGRIMQYDLGNHPSIYIHPESKGQVPSDGNTVIGGFRTLPSPQSDFTWPSPPKLDCKPYTCVVRSKNADSTVIYMESQIEDSNDEKYRTHKGLQFKRLITVYKASTRVKVEMTMLNKNGSTMKHGIWDITQSVCTNNGSVDKKNFWVYFQRNPSSKLGNGKGYVQYMHEGTDDSQWRPDAAPGGIMGVQYMQKTGKIGADCSAGWICFVDQLDGYAYVKTFTYEEGKEYPDEGASVQVYTYTDMPVVEVEVLGPLTTLNTGDSVIMVENWYATRASGPVLAVNNAGLITKRLEAQQTADTMAVNGTYGLFHSGIVKSVYVDDEGEEVLVADSVTVTPLDSLKINRKNQVPAGALVLRLEAFDKSGKSLGTLDSVLVPEPVAVRGSFENRSAMASGKMTLIAKRGLISGKVHTGGTFSVSIFDLKGKLLLKHGNSSLDGSFTIPVDISGSLLVRVAANGWTESRIVTVVK
ncbi:MAG: hypothetical protein GX640_13800 [Fibrobacter sp.]|nr:hypothetical protein [Fibrobacter sp.]